MSDFNIYDVAAGTRRRVAWRTTRAEKAGGHPVFAG
jgi:hypothetical protein